MEKSILSPWGWGGEPEWQWQGLSICWRRETHSQRTWVVLGWLVSGHIHWEIDQSFNKLLKFGQYASIDQCTYEYIRFYSKILCKKLVRLLNFFFFHAFIIKLYSQILHQINIYIHLSSLIGTLVKKDYQKSTPCSLANSLTWPMIHVESGDEIRNWNALCCHREISYHPVYHLLQLFYLFKITFINKKYLRR